MPDRTAVKPFALTSCMSWLKPSVAPVGFATDGLQRVADVPAQRELAGELRRVTRHAGGVRRSGTGVVVGIRPCTALNVTAKAWLEVFPQLFV
jgi:hypothetical protein